MRRWLHICAVTQFSHDHWPLCSRCVLTVVSIAPWSRAPVSLVTGLWNVILQPVYMLTDQTSDTHTSQHHNVAFSITDPLNRTQNVSSEHNMNWTALQCYFRKWKLNMDFFIFGVWNGYVSPGRRPVSWIYHLPIPLLLGEEHHNLCFIKTHLMPL